MGSNLFSDNMVNIAILRQRAFNYRWAVVAPDVIPLTAADPDFPIADIIKEKMTSYIKEGYFSYGPPEGFLSFREACAERAIHHNSIECNSEVIFPTPGVASGMSLIAKTFLSKGDEAIIFDPVDFLFRLSIENAGATPVCCPIDIKTGEIDFDFMESLITPKTKMIWLCNPHNPLGKVFTSDELIKIGKLALKYQLWIVSDEIWSNIIYNPAKHISIASLDSEIANKTLTLFGFSKDFCLAGLSVGYIISPTREAHNNLVQHSGCLATTYGVSVLAQVAAEAALRDGWNWHAAFIEHLYKMRNYAVSRFNKMPQISCNCPHATYVLFINIDSLNMTSQAVYDYLLKAKVAVVPCTPQFFGEGAKGHIRISYATSHQILQEALDRIEKALNHI
jgi:aspartate/methionine/tyrosine aminotransferase